MKKSIIEKAQSEITLELNREIMELKATLKDATKQYEELQSEKQKEEVTIETLRGKIQDFIKEKMENKKE